MNRVKLNDNKLQAAKIIIVILMIVFSIRLIGLLVTFGLILTEKQLRTSIKLQWVDDIISSTFYITILYQFLRLIKIFVDEKIITIFALSRVKQLSFGIYGLLIFRVIFGVVQVCDDSVSLSSHKNYTHGLIQYNSLFYKLGLTFGTICRYVFLDNIDILIGVGVVWFFTKVFQRAFFLQQEQDLTI